jgi:hypothetical protein
MVDDQRQDERGAGDREGDRKQNGRTCLLALAFRSLVLVDEAGSCHLSV